MKTKLSSYSANRFAFPVSLCLLLLTVSCGKAAESLPESTSDVGESVSYQTESDTEMNEASDKPDLPDKDYGGYEFVIYGRSDFEKYLYTDGATGDSLNDAVYQRNIAVCEQFNISISYQYALSDTNGTAAAKNLMAGDADTYDLIAPHARCAFTDYIMNELACNWYDLPYVALDKPYWYQDAINSLTIRGKLYGMVGDIDYGCIDRHIAMFFNKQMVGAYDLTSPYELVRSGKWTLDSFGDMIKETGSDLNGDGTLTIEDDQFGYATGMWVGPSNVFTASGGHICELNSDGAMILTLNTPKTADIFEKYFNIVDGDGCNLILNTDIMPNLQAFHDGRVFIIDSTMNNVVSLRNMDVDFGIIPWPKYDEDQKDYCTTLGAACDLLIVPACSSDLERTSVILEALAWGGKNTIIPAYYSTTLQDKITRDTESAEMLDLIFSSGVFDIANFTDVNSKYFGSIGVDLAKSKDHGFSSYYAKNEKSAEQSIEKVNEKFALLP